MTTFSLKDQSSKPYAWMIEGVELEDVERAGVEAWVRDYAKGTIMTFAQCDDSDANDETIYRNWRRDTYEFEQAVEFISECINEELHPDVEAEFSVSSPYNPGEWRLSRKVYGPRGGVSWVRIHSTPATGGLLKLRVPKGDYKVTYWGNGFPNSYEMSV